MFRIASRYRMKMGSQQLLACSILLILIRVSSLTKCLYTDYSADPCNRCETDEECVRFSSKTSNYSCCEVKDGHKCCRNPNTVPPDNRHCASTKYVGNCEKCHKDDTCNREGFICCNHARHPYPCCLEIIDTITTDGCIPKPNERPGGCKFPCLDSEDCNYGEKCCQEGSVKCCQGTDEGIPNACIPRPNERPGGCKSPCIDDEDCHDGGTCCPEGSGKCCQQTDDGVCPAYFPFVKGQLCKEPCVAGSCSGRGICCSYTHPPKWANSGNKCCFTPEPESDRIGCPDSKNIPATCDMCTKDEDCPFGKSCCKAGNKMCCLAPPKGVCPAFFPFVSGQKCMEPCTSRACSGEGICCSYTHPAKWVNSSYKCCFTPEYYGDSSEELTCAALTGPPQNCIKCDTNAECGKDKVCCKAGGMPCCTWMFGANCPNYIPLHPKEECTSCSESLGCINLEESCCNHTYTANGARTSCCYSSARKTTPSPTTPSTAKPTVLPENPFCTTLEAQQTLFHQCNLCTSTGLCGVGTFCCYIYNIGRYCCVGPSKNPNPPPVTRHPCAHPRLLAMRHHNCDYCAGPCRYPDTTCCEINHLRTNCCIKNIY